MPIYSGLNVLMLWGFLSSQGVCLLECGHRWSRPPPAANEAIMAEKTELTGPLGTVGSVRSP